jgi:hypothetical protein
LCYRDRVSEASRPLRECPRKGCNVMDVSEVGRQYVGERESHKARDAVAHCYTSAQLHLRPQHAMPLLALPPEILGHVASFADTPCLASLCGTSTTLRDIILPILYSHLDCQSLTGALRLFRACTDVKDQRLYVHQYAREVKAISLPTRQASREVKASIAFSLARAISEGCFPNLQCLCWTFSHQRDHSYDSDGNARMFDEPLWRALDERYVSL